MSLIGWLFVVKNPDSVRERVSGLWMCKHKLEQIPFCTCHNLNPNTHSSSKLLPSKEAQDFFSGCANASLNIFPFARAKTPIQTHFRLHSCYPRTKTVPPRLQKQNCTNCVFCAAHVQCTHSARSSARSSARPQNGLNTMGLAFFDNLQKHFFRVFSSFLGKYLVFTPFCGCALWRAL